MAGFEPATSASQTPRATKLRHIPGVPSLPGRSQRSSNRKSISAAISPSVRLKSGMAPAVVVS